MSIILQCVFIQQVFGNIFIKQLKEKNETAYMSVQTYINKIVSTKPELSLP